jgi:hypothetical protein
VYGIVAADDDRDQPHWSKTSYFSHILHHLLFPRESATGTSLPVRCYCLLELPCLSIALVKRRQKTVHLLQGTPTHHPPSIFKHSNAVSREKSSFLPVGEGGLVWCSEIEKGEKTGNRVIVPRSTTPQMYDGMAC